MKGMIKILKENNIFIKKIHWILIVKCELVFLMMILNLDFCE